MSEKLHILIIDDDKVDRMHLLRMLRSSDFELTFQEAEDGYQGIQIALHDNFDVIFLDYMLPKENGLEVLKKIRNANIDIPVIILTGRGDENTAVQIMKAGASDYLSKDSITAVSLLHSLESVLKLYSLEKNAEKSQQQLETLVKKTASLTGEAFFDAMVSAVSEMIGVDCCFIAKFEDSDIQILASNNLNCKKFDEIRIDPNLMDYFINSSRASIPVNNFIDKNSFLNPYKDGFLSGNLIKDTTGEPRAIMCTINTCEFEISSHDKSILHLFDERVWAEIERTQSKYALIENEEKFRTIFENSFDAIAVFNDEKIVVANEACANLFKFPTLDELYKSSFYELFPSKDDLQSRNYLLSIFETAKLGSLHTTLELKGICNDKSEIDLSINLTNYKRDNNVLIVAIIRNITEEKRISYRMAFEKERLSATLSSITDGVLTIDQNRDIVLVNKRAQSILEMNESALIGSKFSDCCELIDTKKNSVIEGTIKNVLDNGLAGTWENYRALRLIDSGKIKQIELSISPFRSSSYDVVGAVIAIRDVTEKQKIEQELSKAEKIETIGIMAGGIAHDFNNLLTAILGNISLSKMFVQDNEKASKRLGEAEKATMMARDLTQQLLTFSKGGVPIKKTTESLPELVKESAEFVLRGSSVELLFNFEKKIYPAEIDVGQINQVINNLLINANQAMENKGSIEIKLHNFYKDESHKLPLMNGPYVILSIKDNGPGMSPAQLDKIFEPYFTTKEKGSGLGLANCYNIIKKHNGYMTVLSEEGEGTEFFIYLPATQDAVVHTKKETKHYSKGQGHILVMDDDKEIGNIIKQMLLISGYDVTLARNGNDAITMLEEAELSGNPFICAMLDLTIKGGMGAVDIIEELKKLSPNLKSIITSGYSTDDVVVNYSNYGFDNSIIKPYQYEELVNTLQNVLN